MQRTRRNFSNEIIKCDGFIAMSSGAQALYIQLLGSCDDEGFTSSMNLCKFMAHATDEDEQELIKRRFIFVFEKDGAKTTVIKHWRMNNWIQNTKVIPSVFAERSKVYINANGNYTLDPNEGSPLVTSKLDESNTEITNQSTSHKKESCTKKKTTQHNPTQLNSTQSNITQHNSTQHNTIQSNPTQSNPTEEDNDDDEIPI